MDALFGWLAREARSFMEAKRLHERILTFDSHCDTPMFFGKDIDFGRRDPQVLVDLHKMHEGRLDAAETAIQQLAQAVAAMKPHLTPDGLIAITSGQTPDGWSVCDGRASTPDLSDFAVSPLTYIRKKS